MTEVTRNNIIPADSITRKLRQQIFTLSSIAIIGILIGVALSLFVTLQQVQTQMEDINSEATRRFELFFLEIQSNLLASGDTLSEEADVNAELLQILTRNQAIVDVILVDLNGNLIAQKNAIGRQKRSPDSLIEWLDPTPGFGEVAVSPLIFEGDNPTVEMAAIATDEIGLSSGVLIVRIDLTELWIATLDIEVGETGYAYITDEKGQLVAFQNLEVERGSMLADLVGRTPQEIAGNDLSLYVGLNNQLVLGKGQALERVLWFAVVEQPIFEALRPFYIPALVLALTLIGIVLIVRNTTEFTQNRIVKPLSALSNTVVEMTGGDLEQRTSVSYKDELGQLGRSFNSMADQLQNSFTMLEQRVEDRTQSLAAIAAITEQINTILNLDELLDKIVNEVQLRFGYYHIQFYRVDDEREQLFVAAGTGEAGKALVNARHQIAFHAQTSLVAQAARSKEMVIAKNVRERSDWLPNDLLPDTYSEIAVPIVIDGNTVGVLDVQENVTAAFDENDANVMRSLAGQVASAIRNAEVFESVQKALSDLRLAQKRYTEEAWQSRAETSDQLHHLYSQLSTEVSEHIDDMVTKAQELSSTADAPSVVHFDEVDSEALISPVRIRGANVGTLQIHASNSETIRDEDNRIIVEAVMEQFGQTAENLRLFDETRRKANQEQMTREITDKMRSATNLSDLIRRTAEELNSRFGAQYTLIELGSDHIIAERNNGNGH